MKKIVAILMCLIMVLSLFSCNNRNINDNENNPTNSNINSETSPDDPIQENFADYSGVLAMYRSIIDILPNYTDFTDAMDQYCAELGIVDEREKELFKKLFWSTFDFKKSPPYKLSCGYATEDLNNDGVDELVLLNNDYMVIAIFSFADGKPVLLGNYIPRGSCWIDGDGLLHVDGSGGAMCNDTSIYKVADGGNQLNLQIGFGMCDHTDTQEYKVEYYKTVNTKKIIITEAEYNSLRDQYGKYLGSHAGAEATKEYAGLNFTPLFTEAEIAMEMYEAVLKNNVKVYETDIEKYNFLLDCKTPYSRIPLRECEDLCYVYMDFDDDSTKTLVIDCGDTLILRYYEGTVYVYPFTFRAISRLNTDGSYSWNDNRGSFEYGEDQLTFDGAELKTKELWRIVNDGEPNAEYYIDGKQVSLQKILKYFEDNPKSKVEFSPLEVPWQNNEYPDGKG